MTPEDIFAHVVRVQNVLRAVGQAETAEEMGRQFNAPSTGRPVVFVAGEDKRGKSSLVNALLRSPGASPVGNEVVTSAPITFFQSDTPGAAVYYYGASEPVRMEPDAARLLATVQGNPGNAENVRAVRIGLDAPLLHAITLVDTPGVGGLNSSHGTLTLQALRHADALIFVIEAGAQFRGEELAFLEEAADRIDSVIFVMTKVDVNKSWRTILDDNRRVLREKAPRFAECDFMPVSSALALRALQLDDEGEIANVRDEAGFRALEKLLNDDVISRSLVLKQRNAVRLGASAISDLEHSILAKLEALDTGGANKERLEAEQKRYQQLNRERADWPQRLDGEIRKITMERSEVTSAKTLELRHRFEQLMKTATPMLQQQMPADVIAELTALAGAVNESTADQLSRIVRTLVSEIDDLTSVDAAIADLADNSVQANLESMTMGSHDLTNADKVGLVGSFSSGRGIMEFVSGGLGPGLGLTSTAFLAPPLGIMLGIGVGAFFAFQSFKGRSQQAFNAEFRAWMGEQIAQTNLAVNSTFSRKVIDLQAEIKSVIQAALDQREREIAEALQATQELLKAEVAQRRQAEGELIRQRDAVQRLKAEADAIFVQLGTASPLSAVSA